MAAPAPPHQERQRMVVVSRATSAASPWCEQIRKGDLHHHPLETSPGYFFPLCISAFVCISCHASWLPAQVPGAGARGGCSSWEQGADLGRQRTCGRPGLRAGLALPKVGENLMGNPKRSLAPKSPSRQTSRLCSKTSGHVQQNPATTSSWNLREIATYFSFLLMAVY